MKTARKATAILIALMILVGVFAGCTKKDSDKDATRETTAMVENEGDTDRATTKPVESTKSPIKTSSTKAGDVVYFGKYEQDNDLTNGKEKIAWRVLTVENGKALLLSDKILDCKPYNVEYKDVTWETCTLRAWLNDDFYKIAFTDAEQARILATDVVNEDNPRNGTSGGNNTQDKIFLLSYEEADKYFYNDAARTAQSTGFSINNGLCAPNESAYSKNGGWWLRSPGLEQSGAVIVDFYGYIRINYYVYYTDVGARPALWIKTVENKGDTDGSSMKPDESTESPIIPSSTTKAGDVVYFGKYEQDNDLTNGKEKIAWRVLTVKNSKAFLLADKTLDAKPYNFESKAVTWETCSLRAWLNDDFYNTAFTAAEQAKILTTEVENEDNPISGTGGGNNTNDKLFLLSYSEVTNPAYGFSSDFSTYDTARWAQGTDFAKGNGLWVLTDSSYLGNSSWWLRPHDDDPCFTSVVDGKGFVASLFGSPVDRTYNGVRPALWINL